MKNQLRNGVAPKKEQNKKIDTSDMVVSEGVSAIEKEIEAKNRGGWFTKKPSKS